MIPQNGSYIISTTPSDEEMEKIHLEVKKYNSKFRYGGIFEPDPDISLVLQDSDGIIIGGVYTDMIAGIMHLDTLWVHKDYRKRGFGKALILHAEQIGKKKGYFASQTMTFDFQAPYFYQKLGYKQLGVFDGYVNGIKEYILLKKFDQESSHQHQGDVNIGECKIIEDKSEFAIKSLNRGLSAYVSQHVGELRKQNSEIEIQLIMKDSRTQNLIGGLFAETTLKVIYISEIWIADSYRRHGYGRKLIKKAEEIAIENGCISVMTNALTFQNPKFFKKLGYSIFAISDGFPSTLKDNYFRKNL